MIIFSMQCFLLPAVPLNAPPYSFTPLLVLANGLLPVFRIGGPNGLDRLDRLRGPVQSSVFGGPGSPVCASWTAWTACVIWAQVQKAIIYVDVSRHLDAFVRANLVNYHQKISQTRWINPTMAPSFYL